MENLKKGPTYNTALPEAFCRRMREQLGEKAEAFLESRNEESIYSIRINALKKTGQESADMLCPGEAVPWERYGRYCDRTVFTGKNPLHAAGLYYIQEASAMISAAVLMEERSGDGERILDLCSAPGGKGTQIASYMKGKGLLICNEIIPKRAAILSENIERIGAGNVLVTNHDPAELADRFPSFFTRILVDAPCSGEGMFRKHPEAVEEWSEESVKSCALRQAGILDMAAHMLCEGGTLVYSTCTFSGEENEDTIAAFLDRRDDLELIRQGRLYPHEVRGEGHFYALLKKKGGPVYGGVPSGGEMNAKYRADRTSREAAAEFFREYCKGFDPVDNDNDIYMFGQNMYLAPPMCPSLDGLKVLRCGLQLGSLKGKGRYRFEPSHALALYLGAEDAVSARSLTEQEAQQYLRGMTLQASYADSGWCLVTYRGCSLGWGKAAGGVLKNHYPRGLRIV